MNETRLGILDLGFRNTDSLTAVDNIIEYAIEVEKNGFSRFWLAEHHPPNPKHPYNNPEILISLVAGNTEHIRIGSAGSLIGYYSPYLLVANYKLLNNLFDDRIDFGLSKGRPSNSDKHDFFRLRNLSHFELFNNNLEDICKLFRDELQNFEQKEIVIPPFGGKIPQLWYLSNSYNSFDLAIKESFNYCRSLIHGLDLLKQDYEKEKLDYFREQYYKVNGFYPKVSVAIAISFEKSEEDIKIAEANATNRREAFTIISVNEENIKEVLVNIIDNYGVDEIIIYDEEIDNLKKIENLKKIGKLIGNF